MTSTVQTNRVALFFTSEATGQVSAACLIARLIVPGLAVVMCQPLCLHVAVTCSLRKAVHMHTGDVCISGTKAFMVHVFDSASTI